MGPVQPVLSTCSLYLLAAAAYRESFTMSGGHSGIYQSQKLCGAVLRLLLLIFKSKQPRFTQTGEIDLVDVR